MVRRDRNLNGMIKMQRKLTLKLARVPEIIGIKKRNQAGACIGDTNITGTPWSRCMKFVGYGEKSESGISANQPLRTGPGIGLGAVIDQQTFPKRKSL